MPLPQRESAKSGSHVHNPPDRSVLTDRDRLATALADRYRLDRQIGAGGMATVYLAHEVAGDRKVAIKVLRPDLAAILGTERFLREIKIATQLDHPHVVGLLDSGTLPAAPGASQEGLYYVMPYIDGESLRERMVREPQLPLETTMNIASQVAEVLDYAHRNGLVHRDIKPENILLTGDQVFVTDFGIARAVGTAGGTKLTETGLSVGTPAYMSPEQSLSENIDGRTDVYALGCVVYEMLVGEPPYTGPTAQAIIARRLSERLPSLRVVRDALPKSVESAVHQALARTPADRYATAGEFVVALRDRSADRAGSPRWRIAAIVAALIVVALAAGWYLRRSAPVAYAKVIAVLPLSIRPAADTTLERLASALVSTLSADLGQVSGIRTVNADKVLGTSTSVALAAYGPAAVELGRKVGARSVLFGSLSAMGNGTVQVDLKLLAADSSSDTLAVVSATGKADSITALTDSLSFKLLRKIWRHGAPPSPSLASITTHSIPALAAFLQGEQLGLSGRWSDAALSYEAAFRLDTTFWLAGWRRNEAQQWMPGEGDVNDSLQRKIEAHRTSFGERDRLLVAAEMTAGTEPLAVHIKRFRDISERFSSDWAAVWPYADHILHSGALIGYTGAEVRAALAQAVALNPKLINAWEHLYAASAGRDSVRSESARSALMNLGDTLPPFGLYYSPIARLAAMTDVAPPAAAFDSAAAFVRRSPPKYGYSYLFLAAVGYPGRQLTLDRLLLSNPPSDPDARNRVSQAVAFAWAVRGVWDSAVFAAEKPGAFSPRVAPLEVYRYAITGAWLGGSVKEAVARRAAAARSVAENVDDPGAKRARGRLIWLDALLAIMQRDTVALATQRKALRAALGDKGAADGRDRTLAAFQLLLRDKTRAAADSLAAIDLGAAEFDVTAHEELARSVGHLTGAQLLLQLGDTVRALKLLTWPEADRAEPIPFFFVPIADLWQARVADAQHRKADAIYYYRQFLQRYDVPTPANQQIIDEARHALARLYGLSEPGRAP